MTISTTESRIEYLGNGTTAIFTIPFRFLENSHIVATLTTAGGDQFPLSQGADYTVTGADDDGGGFLTMSSSPTVGSTLVIRRVVPSTQETDYISGDPFPAESHERALDKLTMLVQQGEEVSDRTLKFPVGDLSTQIGELPAAALRANRLLAFDNLGRPFTTAPVGGSATDLVISLAGSSGSSMIGFMQSGAGAVPRTTQDELRDRVSVRQFGAVGDGVTDDSGAIQKADAYAKINGKQVYFPAGVYGTTVTLLCSVPWCGERNINIWGDAAGGSSIVTIGAGNAAVWTDISGADAPINPCVVFARNEACIANLTIRTVAPYWHSGVFVPGTRRNSLERVYTPGHWTASGLYLDATWSAFNAALTALHPNVQSSAGCLEFTARDCFFVHGKWGASCIGTSRNPDDYTSNPAVPGGWVWGYGGTSDMGFYSCLFGSSGDLAARQADGGGWKHDAAMKNTAKAGQTHSFHGCSFRTYSRYTVWLGRSHRDVFLGGYAETAASDLGFAAAFNVQTPAAAGFGDVLLNGFKHNGPFKLDDVQVASQESTYQWSQTRRVSLISIDSSMIKTANLNMDDNSGSSIIGRDASGTVVFARDTGSGAPVVHLVVTDGTIYPFASGTMLLGNASNFFSQMRATQFITGAGASLRGGEGSPEGVVTAVVGSLYSRIDGGAGTSLYVKQSGTGNTGWVAK